MIPKSKAIYVKIPVEAADALFRLSTREYRHPRDQAAVMLVDALCSAGVLATGGDADRTIVTVSGAGEPRT